MLIEIGIAMIFLGVGLFLGKMLNKDFFDKIKQKKQQKLKQKEQMRAIELKAREEAIQSLYPEIVKKMKEQELKKITGEDKKEKMEKFANAFSMGGNNSQQGNTQNKFANAFNMNTQQGNNSEDKISKMLGTNTNNTNNFEKILGSMNTNTNTNTDKILGKKEEKQSQEEKQSEEERILNFLK